MTMQVGDARTPSWLALWWWRRAAHRRQIELAAVDLHERYGETDGATLDASPVRVKLAGRLMTRRVMGKAAFAHIQDMSGRIQIFMQRDHLPEGLRCSTARL